MKTAVRIAGLLLLLTAVNFSVYFLTAGKHDIPAVASDESTTLSPPDTLVLTFAGDLMAHSVNFSMGDYSDIYRDIKPIVAAADLAFINLETPVVDGDDFSTFPRFNVKRSYVEAAIDGGFDVFALANNHSTDQEGPGILATLREMSSLAEERRISFSGIRPHQRSPMTPVEINAGNWKVGFLSITSFVNVWSGNELVFLADYYRNDELEKELLKFIGAIAPLYDVLVLAVHDGMEYEHIPMERKKEFFRKLSEAGADMVWGHHSHVLQPWEIHEGENGRRGVIAYSMGNFISGQTWNIDPEDPENERNATGDSFLLTVTFTRPADGEGREHGSGVMVERVQPFAAFNYRDARKGMIVRPMETIVGDPDVPESWRNYYRDREKRLEWFLEPEKQQSDEQDQS
jgi:poly-gamma-glutamate synthesis protein (capsule biosynthesis protein)